MRRAGKHRSAVPTADSEQKTPGHMQSTSSRGFPGGGCVAERSTDRSVSYWLRRGLSPTSLLVFSVRLKAKSALVNTGAHTRAHAHTHSRPHLVISR